MPVLWMNKVGPRKVSTLLQVSYLVSCGAGKYNRLRSSNAFCCIHTILQLKKELQPLLSHLIFTMTYNRSVLFHYSNAEIRAK